MFCWILKRPTKKNPTSPYSAIPEVIHHKEKCQGATSSGLCCYFSFSLFISFTLTVSKGALCLHPTRFYSLQYRDHVEPHLIHTYIHLPHIQVYLWMYFAKCALHMQLPLLSFRRYSYSFASHNVKYLYFTDKLQKSVISAARSVCFWCSPTWWFGYF